MSEVTDRDVLDAADALRHRLHLIKELNSVLPDAESGDTDAMLKAAHLYSETARPELAEKWRKLAAKGRPGKARRLRTAASTR